MKKVIRIFALAALLLGLTFQAEAKDRAHTLKIYNWADYIDEDLLEEFKVWYHELTGEEILKAMENKSFSAKDLADKLLEEEHEHHHHHHHYDENGVCSCGHHHDDDDDEDEEEHEHHHRQGMEDDPWNREGSGREGSCEDKNCRSRRIQRPHLTCLQSHP